MNIDRWTGVESKALRKAMLLSIEKFAARTGIAERTIANWEARGNCAQLRPSSQELLERTLLQAPEVVMNRFRRALRDIESSREQSDHQEQATVTLATTSGGDFLPTVLGVDDADSVWVHARTIAGEVVLVSLPRRAVVAGFGVGALAAAVGVKPAAAIATNPEIDHVAHFRALRLALIESDNLHGSRGVVALTEQSLSVMAELRRAGVGDNAEMQRMRILFAEFAGWLYQDGREWTRAQHWTDRALTWSHQLGDDYYIAATLIRKAQIANDQGEGAEAMELAEAAERAAPTGTRLPAVAATFAAHGAALTGDRARCARGFDRAYQHLDDAKEDSTWGFFLDAPYIDVYQAHSRAALGDYRSAIEQFDRSIRSLQAGYTRDEAVYAARYAVACARAGDAEPAARLGMTALEVGVSTGSERVLHTVRELDGALGAAAVEDVREFREAARRWAVIAR